MKQIREHRPQCINFNVNELFIQSDLHHSRKRYQIYGIISGLRNFALEMMETDCARNTGQLQVLGSSLNLVWCYQFLFRFELN